MPFVVHSSLLAIGLPLIALPVLIHLINLLRHRRVEWAAMEFLLVSQRKHRKWIILKQLLLLLMRMAAVAALVLMVAQPVLQAQWGALFGGTKTHHIVLLDDSYSMSDRWGSTSAFEEAKHMIERVAAEATRKPTPQSFTLLRFSRVRRGGAGTQPDMLEQAVQSDFAAQLEQTLGRMDVSESAAGPLEALDAIDGLPVKPEDENRVVYLVSDFRAKEWSEPAPLKKALERLQRTGVQLQFDNCVDAARPNLGIVALRTVSGVRAAGVPLSMEIAVQNFGEKAVRGVTVHIDEDGQTRPAVEFEEIPARKVALRRFQSMFPTTGDHRATARLESDAVAADNTRFGIVAVAEAAPVLIIDSDARGSDGYFVAAALEPGGKATSGLKPMVETPRALRGSLDKYAAIFLTNVERLDPAEIDALEAYARAGGGVAFFVGERVRGDVYNRELYRDGQGIFPLPLGIATELLVDRLDKAPDLEVTDHPIFSVFAGQRNSYLGTVMVERYFTTAKGWSPPPESAVKVIARLRNHAPLVVEQRFGAGRVVAFLTKSSPLATTSGSWNNWARNNPSYVVAMLELESYLAAGRQPESSRTVGTPLEVTFDVARFQPKVRFQLPGRDSSSGPGEGFSGDMLMVDAAPAGRQPRGDASRPRGQRFLRSAAHGPRRSNRTPRLGVQCRFARGRSGPAGQCRSRAASRWPAYQVPRSERLEPCVGATSRLQSGRESDVLSRRTFAMRAASGLCGQLSCLEPRGSPMMQLLLAPPLAQAAADLPTGAATPGALTEPGAHAASRVTYEWARFAAYTERWQFLALGAAVVAILALVIYLYRRDSVELRRGTGVLLAGLRIVALLGLLAYYGKLEKRTERQVTRNSRVLMAIDTSLSMGLRDSEATSSPGAPTRLEQVTAALKDRGLIEELRKTHDVLLSRFDVTTSSVASLAKLPPPNKDSRPDHDENAKAPADETKPAGPAAELVPWSRIAPQGTETRLGQSLRALLEAERSSPVSALIVFTDGAQNAGPDCSPAIQLAHEAKIPIYTVGIGSAKRPANVRISDLVAPTRAYPGDAFTVTGYVQAQELAGRTVTLELTSRPAGGDAGDKDKAGQTKLEATERVLLGGRGEITPVKFEVKPEEHGRRVYRLAVKSPPEDSNPADDQQEVDIEIVDRQTRLLLIASGPTREYTFLRNMLRRDKELVVDVWLQSGKEGISQDASSLLFEFPETPQELFLYDGIIAFDPDWTQLSAESIDMLDRWISEKAGGLIAICGPVETDRWTQEPGLGKLRAIYPVEFNRRLAMLEDGRYGSETPWPIEFTREGLEAEFLWPAESGPKSQRIWASFPGVYGYYAVRGAKPGTTVYARYSDPEAAVSGQQPVYMAEQFYGAGRVFYLGSGEMWRLRALDDGYFEQFYTKLVRHVTQGRLLNGSSRGLLLVERDRYFLGATVAVRAALSNARFEPLDVPRVSLEITLPGGGAQNLELAADPNRKGMFQGQFTALEEGVYKLDLPLPDSREERLTKRVQVKVPDLERETPERNDALLSEIAKRTGGRYLIGPGAIAPATGASPIVAELKDRSETSYLTGVPDLDFDRDWMRDLVRGLRSVVARMAHPSLVETCLNARSTPPESRLLDAHDDFRPGNTRRDCSLARPSAREIRAYVWIEGLALVVAVAFAWFWATLLFDWLFEPPAPLRVALLALLGAGLSYTAYRYLLRRAFVPLADPSLALLVERRHAELGESLLTAVELGEAPAHAAIYNRDMLAHTRRQAEAAARELPLATLFNRGPLRRAVSLAIVLVVAAAAFALGAHDAFEVWTRRNLLLSSELWPRKTHLTIVGFENGAKKVAKGSDLEIVVEAETGAERVVPETVGVRYGSVDGVWARDRMTRVGVATAKDPFQQYAYQFKSLLADREFWVQGGDDRVRALPDRRGR